MHDYSPHPTPVVPDHQLLRRIGQGSYGEVWLARNVFGTHRAVKIVYAENFENRKPYEREFEGIRKFEPISRTHPGLVNILQTGRDDAAGYFYYVMELADDEMAPDAFDPDRYCAKTLNDELHRRGRLPAAEALRLGRSLSAALAHIHQHGLVHRDIKPANIIFVDGQPKLADIGLVTQASSSKSYVGTVGYIAPEGAGSIQGDIFSLGKVLYQMSTGEDCESFPKLPDDLWTYDDKVLVAEMNEVAVKACAQSLEDRYDRADDLHADLEVLQVGRSVKRLRHVERQLKVFKRVAILVGGLALAGMVLVSLLNYLRTREKKLLARAHVTGGARLVESGDRFGALPLFGEALRLERHDPAAVETHRARLGSVLQQSPRLLQFWQTESGLRDVRFSPDGRQLLLAGGARAWLVDIESGTTGHVFTAAEKIETAAFSPDGRRVALAWGDFITVADVAAGTNLFTIPLGDHVYSAEFSPDGETILAACNNRCAHLLDVHDGHQLGPDFFAHQKAVCFAAYSPDGTRIVTSSHDGTACLWDTGTHELLWRLPHNQFVYSASFSPDGRRVVTASSDGTLRLWNATNGNLLVARMEHRGGVRRASFSPDGRFIISAGLDQTVRFWNARTGRPAGSMLDLPAYAMQAVFDADARRVAVVGFTGEVKVWQVAPPAPHSAAQPAVVSADGARYVAWASNTLQVMSARDDLPLTTRVPAEESILAILCDAPGGRVLVQTPGRDRNSKRVQVFEDGVASTNVFTIAGSGQRWWLRADGTRLLTATGRFFSLWDVSGGQLIFQSKELPDAVTAAAFSPDGRWFAVADGGGRSVRIFDAHTGEPLHAPLPHDDKVHALAFSPDSSRLVTGTSTPDFNPGAARLWSVRTGTPIGALMPHADGVEQAVFSHDGRLVATCAEDERASVWDAATGAHVAGPIAPGAPVLSVEFSADDRWLVTATWYQAQVWEARTGLAVTPPFSDPAIFERAGLCADGRRVWVQSRRGLLLWDLPRAAGGPDELMAFAHHLGATVPSSVRWDQNAFTLAQLRVHCATERARTGANLAVWQREQAELSEADQDWFAAQFHLARRLNNQPDDAALRARLENAQSKLEAAP